MWRNKDFVSVLLRGFEDALHILDGLVLRDTLADELPREPLFTQHFILRVDKYHGGVTLIHVHSYLLSTMWLAPHSQVRLSRGCCAHLSPGRFINRSYSGE